MEIEYWILATVPILAVTAIIDSITRLSRWLTSHAGNYDELWAHLFLLVAVFIGFASWLSSRPDIETAFFIKDFMYAETQDNSSENHHWPSPS